MNIHRWTALAFAISVAGAAQAQERGRTDGPEGSEYGKGGYERAPLNGGNFSIALDWGADVLDSGASNGTPMMVGATLTWWEDDWFLLDFSGAYLGNGKRTDLLVGPRFRTPYWPVALSVGLKAGAIFFPQGSLPTFDSSTSVRFGLSPQVGLDLVVHDRIPLSLNYAIDIPVGTPEGADLIAHRIFMSVGYRF